MKLQQAGPFVFRMGGGDGITSVLNIKSGGENELLTRAPTSGKHSLWSGTRFGPRECYCEIFVIHCEHTWGLILFLIPLQLVIVAMGNAIHPISSNRQILEEVVLISSRSLWLCKEEKGKRIRVWKYKNWLNKHCALGTSKHQIKF